MNKIPENKTRKRLRLFLCFLYLLEIVLCTFPYYQVVQDGKLVTNSVFEVLSALGTGNTMGMASDQFSAVSRFLPMNFISWSFPFLIHAHLNRDRIADSGIAPAIGILTLDP